MTTIDRQKYVAELGKLLSGMARADREAVLRGVNARFDEAGDDDAVIAALGSPTFAAVSVLRGYTPPEDLDEEEYDGDEEYQYVEPSAAPAQDAPEEGVNAAPEAESSEPDEVSPGQTPPEADEAPIEEAAAEEGQESPAEPGTPPEGEPESATEEEPAATEEAAPEEGVNAAPEAESSEPDEASPGQTPPEADEAPIEEAAAADEPCETVDIGLGTIEVYSDATAEPEAEADEPAPEEEPSEETAEPEMPAEPEPQFDSAPEPELEYEIPAAAEEGMKLHGGRVFASVLLGIVPGIPLAVVLILVALAILAVGAALVYAGGVFISFAFLGMGVVADILLTVGFGLAVAAVGLPIVFLAVWFFLRCVVGLYGRMFAKAGAWCRGEEREA